MALGKEQAVALYLTAGCVASFASYIHKIVAGVSGASLGAVSFITFEVCIKVRTTYKPIAIFSVWCHSWNIGIRLF